MKVGIILVGYNMESYVTPCLRPWFQARAEKLGGHEFAICAVSLPFAGFPNDEKDNTGDILKMHLDLGQIDHLITEPANIPETTARGMALTYLMGQDVDILWQVDLDEFYTIEQIDFILRTLDINPWLAWARLSFQNYVFDDRTYLVDPFTPPRIHRVIPSRYPSIRPSCFTADNDIGYRNKDEPNGTIWFQDSLPSQTIPAGACWIRHYTWPSNERSKAKVAYQTGRGWKCSFAWDEAADKLIFNPALPQPKTRRDE